MGNKPGPQPQYPEKLPKGASFLNQIKYQFRYSLVEFQLRHDLSKEDICEELGVSKNTFADYYKFNVKSFPRMLKAVKLVRWAMDLVRAPKFPFRPINYVRWFEGDPLTKGEKHLQKEIKTLKQNEQYYKERIAYLEKKFTPENAE